MGDTASEIAVKTAEEFYLSQHGNDDFLSSCFETAQNRLLQKQEETHCQNGLKTTLVVLEIFGEQYRFGHIGDSRCYCFAENQLQTRTLDHSVPQMLVQIGEIEENEIRHHPDRNRLLRVLGAEWGTMKYELASAEPTKNHLSFLLCSDGFWENIEEKRMEELLESADSPEQWLGTMAQEVEQNGKGTNADNYSAIAVWIRN